jgi:hypothetical protein
MMYRPVGLDEKKHGSKSEEEQAMVYSNEEERATLHESEEDFEVEK